MNVRYYFRELLLLYSLCKPWTLHDVKMHPHINSYSVVIRHEYVVTAFAGEFVCEFG